MLYGHTMSARLNPALINLYSMRSCTRLAALAGRRNALYLVLFMYLPVLELLAGSVIPEVARMHCLLTQGAAETDETLRVVSHSRVFALGDVSGVKSMPETDSLPITAQARAAPDVRDRVCRLIVAPWNLAWHVPSVARLRPEDQCMTSCSCA
jgi:hypothetical protein